MSLAAE